MMSVDVVPLKRLAAVALTLLFALITAAVVGPMAVPRIGDAIAREIASLAAALPVPEAPLDTGLSVLPPPIPVSPPRPPANSRIAHSDHVHPLRPSPPSIATIDIPADRLAPLTETQLRSLRPIEATGADGRPMGVRIAGVAALRLGLDDSDVVTSIEGRSTPDFASALAVAVKAYASGQDAARAIVLRGGRPLAVVLHIPRRVRDPKN